MDGQRKLNESKDVFYGLLGRLRYFVSKEKWELAARLSWILMGRLYDKTINKMFASQFVAVSSRIPKKYLSTSHKIKLLVARFAPRVFCLKLKKGNKNEERS